MTPFEYGEMFAKAATVQPLVKQFRRVLTAMQQKTHDFHGGDALSILRTGAVSPGTTNLFGDGAYFSRHSPEMGYFAKGGYRGVIAPKVNIAAQGGHAVGSGRSGLTYVKAPKGYNLQRGDMVVHTHLSGDKPVVRTAQKAMGVRPVEVPALYGADLAMKGRPVADVERDLKDRRVMDGFRAWVGDRAQ